jgi:hypothetical protein
VPWPVVLDRFEVQSTAPVGSSELKARACERERTSPAEAAPTPIVTAETNVCAIMGSRGAGRFGRLLGHA